MPFGETLTGPRVIIVLQDQSGLGPPHDEPLRERRAPGVLGAGDRNVNDQTFAVEEPGI